MSRWGSDLVVLVPDRNMETAVRGILSRPQALGIRTVQFETYVHVERDPGCFHRGHHFLKPMAARYAHGMILFDRVGSGQAQQTTREMEDVVTARLASAGWGDRAAAIVLDPELEVWVWSNSPHVDRCLGWAGRDPDVRTWLRSQGMWVTGAPKPEDPKRATESVLRYVRKPRSSAIYGQLARSVSLKRCTDPAFLHFRQLISAWFPQRAEGLA